MGVDFDCHFAHVKMELFKPGQRARDWVRYCENLHRLVKSPTTWMSPVMETEGLASFSSTWTSILNQ